MWGMGRHGIRNSFLTGAPGVRDAFLHWGGSGSRK